MENGSWRRPLACCILLVMIMLISPGTIRAGKLDDFEREIITDHPKTTYTPNTGCYAENEGKKHLRDEFWEGCISGCISSGCFKGLLGEFIKAMYRGGTNSLAQNQTAPAESVAQEVPSPPCSMGGTNSLAQTQTTPAESGTQEVPPPPCSTGEPLKPLFRIDISYQNVESDIEAIDARIELGYGPLGIQYRYTTYREKEPDDTLNITQFHLLYRMSFMATLGIDAGVGVFTIEGNEEISGYSLTLPIHAHSSKGWGMEFRPVWAEINDTTIEDYALGFFLSRRYVMLQAGYRWLTANTTNLNGPYAGFSLLF